jgi:hypothetical protein
VNKDYRHLDEEEQPKNLEEEISMSRSIREDSQYNFNHPINSNNEIDEKMIKAQRNNYMPTPFLTKVQEKENNKITKTRENKNTERSKSPYFKK